MGKSECDLEPDFRHKCAIQLVEGEDAVDKAYCRLEKNMSGVGVCSCADPNMPCCDPPVGDPPPDPGLEPEPGESSDPGFDQKPGDPPPAPSPSGGEAGGIPG